MADYVSNTPVSGPRQMDWKITWDLGGMAWSHEWGMFYSTSDSDEGLSMRKPTPPSGM